MKLFLRVMALVITAVLPLAGANVASASEPTTTPVPFHETFSGVEGACAFPLTVAFNMDQTERTWVDSSGRVVRVHVTGKGSTKLTNEWSNKSVRVNTSGPTVGNKGVGNWLFIVTEADAPYVPVPVGVWLYKGKVADLNSDDYLSVFKGRVVDLCAALQ